MYYWNKKTENQTTLEEELFTFDKVKEIMIGTAFFSRDGLEIIRKLANKYNLKKDRIKIFLSSEFSNNKPHELLKELDSVCTVKIIFDRIFHSKVYLVKGINNSKLIFGSSNLTNGGFRKNIEFNSIEILENNKLESILKFFDFCEHKAILINDEIIKYYEENSKEIENLCKVQRTLKKKLNGYIKQDDALNEEELDIDKFYFNFLDYETFFIRNQTRDDIEIRERRKSVQDKMLAIHKKIYKMIKKMGIECHWRTENITSLINPCIFNKGMVGWMGIRYGKTKNEVTALNFNAEDSTIGFQKHACLQYCIIPSGFEINLFLAVKHDAIDRAYMHENLKKLQPKIEKEIYKLKGYGMKWEIYDEEMDEYFIFDIDNEDEDTFCEYFKKNDKDGRESFLKLFYEADDIRIESIDNICNEIIKYLKILLPLYNTMVYRPNSLT